MIEGKSKHRFGELLRQFRVREGVSQKELGEFTYTHRNTISAWERSDYVPQTQEIVRTLAVALHLSDEEERVLLEARERFFSLDTLHEDWGDAGAPEPLYGRKEELATLKRWIINEHCRVVALYGIGGIGKTVLTIWFAHQIKRQFHYVFWYPLRNAPPLQLMLKRCILFLSDQRNMDFPDDVHDLLSLLLQYLREHRKIFASRRNCLR